MACGNCAESGEKRADVGTVRISPARMLCWAVDLSPAPRHFAWEVAAGGSAW